MTADPMESTLEGSESLVLPRPAISGVPGVEPTSAGSGVQDKEVLKGVLRELFKEDPDLIKPLIAEIAGPEFDRRFDSSKDRALMLVRNSGPLLELLNRHGVKIPDAAMQELTVSELRQELNDLRTFVRQPGPRQVPEAGQDSFDRITTEVLSELEIPLNDPEVVALAQRTTYPPGDRNAGEKWELALRRLAAKRRKAAAVGSSSALPEGSGAPSGAQAQVVQLRKRYEEEKTHIPRGDVRRITDLQVKYRKLGLDI